MRSCRELDILILGGGHVDYRWRFTLRRLLYRLVWLSDERVEQGRKLGAEVGVDYSTQNVTEELRRITDGRGVDMVLDTGGGTIFDATLGALAEGGRVVTVGGPSGDRSTYQEQELPKKGQ